MNEWSEGHRHMHFLVRTSAYLTQQVVRELWKETLPAFPFTCHADLVRNPGGMARYIAKDIRDDRKKELVPPGFRGRVYTNSRRFFTKEVSALWAEQVREWYPEPW
jgi:hypothetical protein